MANSKLSGTDGVVMQYEFIDFPEFNKYLLPKRSKDMDIPVNMCYRIRNKLSNLYLTAGQTEIPSPDTVTQSKELGSEDEKKYGQVWHVLPFQDKYYQLRNVLSGCYLSVVDVDKPGAQLSHMDRTSFAANAETSTQAWDIIPDKANGENCYLVENAAGNLHVGIRDRETAVVEQNEIKSSGVDLEAQLWIFEVQPFEPQCIFLFDDEDIVEGEEKDIGEVPHDLKRKTCPPATKEVLLGQVKMRFPVVGLKTCDLPEPVLLEGPTYMLRRYGYWGVVKFFEHRGNSLVYSTMEPDVGLITKNGKQIKEVTGITVTSDTTLCLNGPAEKRYGKKLGLALKVPIRREVTGPNCRRITVHFTYNAGLAVTETTWYREYRYVLEEVDGELIMEWKIRDPCYSRIDRQRFVETNPGKPPIPLGFCTKDAEKWRF